MLDQNKTSKLFNNNLEHPVTFLIGFILLIVINVLIVIIGVTAYIQIDEGAPQELNQYTLYIDLNNEKNFIFSQYTYFISENGAEYFIPTKALLKTTDFENIIKNRTPLTIICDGELIYQISDSYETYYATIDNTEKTMFYLSSIHLIISILSLIGAIIFVLISCHILSNAKMYPRLASLLVKEGDRKWENK